MKIKEITGYEMLDSRGNPTVAAEIILESGAKGFAISPSGASTGIHEAHELRDNDKYRYNGKGTLGAVNGINKEIRKTIIENSYEDQKTFDDFLIKLDGTENKSRLGANAILAVSLAFAKASANENNLPLYKYLNNDNEFSMPRPMMNILNGGAHAANNIDIQEFMIVPVFNGLFSDKLRVCSEIYHTLGRMIEAKNLSCGVGDEGGYAPKLSNDEEAIELIADAIFKAGYNTDNIKIALDIASSEWYKNGKYIKPKANTELSSQNMLDIYQKLVDDYPIISLEDPFAEDDFENFAKLNKLIGNRVQIVGDDLFVTNKERLKYGIENGLANSILIKPNQIGTLTETLDVIKLAKSNGIKTIISHRSGETEDTTISDIGVGQNVGQIKSGAPCRTDRVAKYNRLLVIEKELP